MDSRSALKGQENISDGDPIAMKTIFAGSAIIAAALLLGSLISAHPVNTETLLPLHLQQKNGQPTAVQKPDLPGPQAADPLAEVASATSERKTRSAPNREDLLGVSVVPPAFYVATAYSLRGRTASGKHATKGLIAADPKLLPLGSRVRVETHGYSGEYLVADTGGTVRGRRIDIWTPNAREATSFGRRKVKLTVLSYGPRLSPRRKRLPQ